MAYPAGSDQRELAMDAFHDHHRDSIRFHYRRSWWWTRNVEALARVAGRHVIKGGRTISRRRRLPIGVCCSADKPPRHRWQRSTEPRKVKVIFARFDMARAEPRVP